MKLFRMRFLFPFLLCLLLCACLSACDEGGGSSSAGMPATPEQVLSVLAPEATPLPISDVCRQITLPDAELLNVRDAFLGKGFGVIPTDSVPGTKLETVTLKSVDWLVTLIREGDNVHVRWENIDSVALHPLYAESSPVTGEVVMAQIGIPQDEMATGNPMIGMCYIYRLANGTALVIDGGTGTQACADNLLASFERLEIATDEVGKYRVAAWIFTHGHGDHTGAFSAFTLQYADRIDLNYVMYSFPVGDIAPNDCNAADFSAAIAAYYPDAQRISPHAGITYHFGDLSVHMLYTPELLYSDSPVQYFNDTSLIFRVEANGQSVLHTGDAGELAATEAWNAHEESAFQSSALQITHHGLYTGNESHTWTYLKKIYLASDAPVGLLPMGARQPGEERNGRYTVLVDWSRTGFQTAFVTDPRNTQGKDGFTQADYDKFVADVAAGTVKDQTLFGYNGVNLQKNRSGMITYISSNETEPMATVFSLSESGFSLLSNTELGAWLNE